MMTHPATTMAQGLRLEYHDIHPSRTTSRRPSSLRAAGCAAAQASSLLRCILLGNLSHKFSTMATR